MLENYIFDPTLRYESHHLIYSGKEVNEPIAIGGILGAAILCVRLLNTDEASKRGIVISEALQYKQFFEQYDNEVIQDDWGYIQAELEQLDLAYLDLVSTEDFGLQTLCPNKRQLSIVMDMVSTYMRRISLEFFYAHIYDFVPWTAPFAQWLFDAGQAEPQRQQFLQIDWTDAALVHALAVEMSKAPEDRTPLEPVFVFEGEAAADILCRYYDWLWAEVQKEAKLYPDANVQLAEFRTLILEQETNYDFLKPEMKDLPPEQINLFRKWMNQWTDFVQARIQPPTPQRQKKSEEQLFFPDEVLRCPTGDMTEKYAATREYVKERSKYDENFKKFVKNESRARLCRQLTLLFGWYVDPNSLSKSMLRNPKRKTKKYT